MSGVKTSVLFVILLSSVSASGQSASGPKGVFCGGNEMVQYSRPIGATSVIGTPTNWAGKYRAPGFNCRSKAWTPFS